MESEESSMHYPIQASLNITEFTYQDLNQKYDVAPKSTKNDRKYLPMSNPCQVVGAIKESNNPALLFSSDRRRHEPRHQIKIINHEEIIQPIEFTGHSNTSSSSANSQLQQQRNEQISE